MAEIREELYHGWSIQITQDQRGYLFRCWTSEHLIGVTDAQYYPTFGQALRAGHLRADLESVRFSLTTFLRGKRHRLLLDPNEQNALESSISQYIEIARHQFS